MKKIAEQYYAELRRQYATRIRQLVPKYDEMLECITDLVRLSEPKRVLDIGTGVGNVAEIVLRELQDVRVTAIDASAEMISDARQVLRQYGDRVTILQQEIEAFAPQERFDAIFSNLVLHNIPPDEKRRLLGSIAEWLNPTGSFIWGDMIRHSDPGVQQHFVRYRKSLALAAGCPPDLVKANFEKEEKEDYPLTAEETLGLVTEAGFSSPTIAWAHDAFAIFFARK